MIEEKFTHSIHLFLRYDGTPVTFIMRPCSERRRLKTIVEHGGGSLLIRPVSCNYAIKVAVPNMIILDKDVFSTQYILDCVKANQLQDINNYRINKKSYYTDDLDVMDILYGPKDWTTATHRTDDISDGSVVSDIEDQADHSLKPTKNWKTRRHNYKMQDKEAILNFISKNRRHNDVKGRALWQLMETKKVCGNCTWQSMKEHFLKQIIPNLHQFKLHTKEKNRYLKMFTNDICESEDSEEDSDERQKENLTNRGWHEDVEGKEDTPKVSKREMLQTEESLSDDQKQQVVGDEQESRHSGESEMLAVESSDEERFHTQPKSQDGFHTPLESQNRFYTPLKSQDRFQTPLKAKESQEMEALKRCSPRIKQKQQAIEEAMHVDTKQNEHSTVVTCHLDEFGSSNNMADSESFEVSEGPLSLHKNPTSVSKNESAHVIIPTGQKVSESAVGTAGDTKAEIESIRIEKQKEMTSPSLTAFSERSRSGQGSPCLLDSVTESPVKSLAFVTGKNGSPVNTKKVANIKKGQTMTPGSRKQSSVLNTEQFAEITEFQDNTLVIPMKSKKIGESVSDYSETSKEQSKKLYPEKELHASHISSPNTDNTVDRETSSRLIQPVVQVEKLPACVSEKGRIIVNIRQIHEHSGQDNSLTTGSDTEDPHNLEESRKKNMHSDVECSSGEDETEVSLKLKKKRRRIILLDSSESDSDTSETTLESEHKRKKKRRKKLKKRTTPRSHGYDKKRSTAEQDYSADIWDSETTVDTDAETVKLNLSSGEEDFKSRRTKRTDPKRKRQVTGQSPQGMQSSNTRRPDGLSLSSVLGSPNAASTKKPTNLTRIQKKTYSKFYTFAEDQKIVQFIVDTRRFSDIGGNQLWKVMEQKKVLRERTWQSMKERFRKIILPALDQFDLSSNDRKAFTSATKLSDYKFFKQQREGVLGKVAANKANSRKLTVDKQKLSSKDRERGDKKIKLADVSPRKKQGYSEKNLQYNSENIKSADILHDSNYDGNQRSSVMIPLTYKADMTSLSTNEEASYSPSVKRMQRPSGVLLKEISTPECSPSGKQNQKLKASLKSEVLLRKPSQYRQTDKLVSPCGSVSDACNSSLSKKSSQTQKSFDSSRTQSGMQKIKKLQKQLYTTNPMQLKLTPPVNFKVNQKQKRK